MPKVSPALQDEMGLSMQYFVVYTALVIDQTSNQFTSNAHLGAQKIVETARITGTYAAMLSAHFLAALMLAIKFAQDGTENCKMPQPWAQTAMFCCVHAVKFQEIIVLVIPVLNHESEVSTDEHWNLDESHVSNGRIDAMILSAAHFNILLMLYDGSIASIGAVFMMQGPQEFLGNEWQNAIFVDGVSSAVMSTTLFTTMLYAVHVPAVVLKMSVELSGWTPFLPKLEDTLAFDRHPVNFAPMLANLFIDALKHALQVEPKLGRPQR